ncbi:pyridoxal-dependent decarboxylase, exosortase A system-associated [Undibacterium terreum]|uniref:Pyridoxal-dependent decarboxylase, exosortase A system-associated n=1 Tax=Undibacterium terreum TaxID=1224302 RepID=A0A916UZN4_9BURK|nr:pyridoxal-dependent decarboxylase, exosortase A system-associated [Undibacterium terreum]GGC96990.1 pyridoxal-dependent decarboxylase, exosortase A system-associated [Undibacterium terreum]
MTNTKPVHAAQTQFQVLDNCLQIGGMALTRLAQRVGTTPFYAYDRSLLGQRVQYLRTLLPPQLALHYSIKANPMPALVQHMAGLVDGLDVASAGELKVALDTSMAPAAISFAGPGKTEAELSQAVAAGIVINAESLTELERLERIASALGITPKVVIRVNPDFELKSSGMKMGGGPKPFGIDAEVVPQAMQRIRAMGLEFLGFHIFSGSQNLKPAAIIEAQQKSFELAIRLAQDASQEILSLNIGGGFGIPYFPGEVPLDVAPIAEHLHASLPRVHAELPHAKVALEFGRYLVGEAGIYVARVTDVKRSRGELFIVTDGGMHHHLAASGNFGQVIRKNYPVAVGNKMTAAQAGVPAENASVVGPLCTPLDILADQMALAHAEIGDLIVVFQSGAYGLTASPTAFLGHRIAAEVIV